MNVREQAIVRAAIVDAMRVARDMRNPDDRLASFFGAMCGLAGFSDPNEQLSYLLDARCSPEELEQ